MRELGPADAGRRVSLGFPTEMLCFISYTRKQCSLGYGKHVRDLREKCQNSKGKHWERCWFVVAVADDGVDDGNDTAMPANAA